MNRIILSTLALLSLTPACTRIEKTPVPAATARAEDVRVIASHEFGDSRAALSAIADEIRSSLGDPARSGELRRLLAAVLESPDATLEGKLFACRQLALIGTEEEVPSLVPLLEDEQTADVARIALERIPGIAADRALREAMARSEGRARIGVINSIGERRDRNAALLLAGLIENSDPETAAAAATALGKIGESAVLDTLLEARKSSPQSVKLALEEAALRCADRLVSDAEKGHAIPAYETLYNTGSSKGIRAAALEGLIRARGEQAVPLMMAQIRNQEPGKQSQALHLVRRIPGAAATRQIAAELPNLPPAERALLIQALEERGDPACLPEIIKQAAGSDADVQIAALDALGKIGDASVVPTLAQAAAAPDPRVAEAARGSLDQLRAPDTDAALLKLAQSGPEGLDPKSRAQALRSIGARRTPGAGPLLFASAENTNELIRTEAYRGLASFAEPKDLPTLTAMLARESSAEAQKEAVNAIASVASKIPEKQNQSESLLAALRITEQPAARAALLTALGRIGGEAARKELSSAASGDEPQAREAAIAALGGWSDPTPAAELLRIAKKSDPGAQRTLALRGYSRLIGLPENGSEKKRVNDFKEALALARSPDEKKAVIENLRAVYSLDALRLAEPYFKDKDAGKEAIDSGSKIAFWISGSHPAEAKAAMTQALALTQDPTQRKNAELVLKTIEKFEDYINLWQIAGPFEEKGKNGSDLFDIAFAPENGDKDVKWKEVGAGGGSDRPWMIDLQRAMGGTNRVAYLRTWVWSSSEKPARLELGSDDGIKVWLNGDLVHANNANRAISAGEDRAKVTLKSGWNSLLLKVTNGGADWAASARIRNADGTRLDGLKFSPTEPPVQISKN